VEEKGEVHSIIFVICIVVIIIVIIGAVLSVREIWAGIKGEPFDTYKIVIGVVMIGIGGFIYKKVIVPASREWGKRQPS